MIELALESNCEIAKCYLILKLELIKRIESAQVASHSSTSFTDAFLS